MGAVTRIMLGIVPDMGPSCPIDSEAVHSSQNGYNAIESSAQSWQSSGRRGRRSRPREANAKGSVRCFAHGTLCWLFEIFCCFLQFFAARMLARSVLLLHEKMGVFSERIVSALLFPAAMEPPPDSWGFCGRSGRTEGSAAPRRSGRSRSVPECRRS